MTSRVPSWLALLVLPLVLTAACGGNKKRPSGPSPDELASRSERCYARGDYGCAMEALDELRKRRKGEPALLNRFAMVARLRYYQSGEADHRDQELEALRGALAIAPDDPLILVNYGTTCFEMGLGDQALRAYRRVLELRPEHADAALMRTRIEQLASAPEPEEEESP